MSPISLMISGATIGSEDLLEWTEVFWAKFMWLKYKYRYCWSELGKNQGRKKPLK